MAPWGCLFLLGLTLLYAQSPLAIADSFFHAGQYAEALRAYQALTSSSETADSTRLRALIGLARTYLAQRQPLAAAPWLAQAESLASVLSDPIATATCLTLRGAAAFLSQRLPLAESLFTYVRALGPVGGAENYLNATLQLGRLRLAQSAFASAETLLEEALVLAQGQGSPNLYAQSLSLRAQLHFLRGQYLLAEKYLQTALGLPGLPRPIQLNLLNALGAVYFHRGELLRAEEIFEQIIQTLETLPLNQPLLPSAYYNLALILDQQGRYSEAEKYYQKALALLHQQGDTQSIFYHRLRSGLAVLYRHQQRYAEAESLLRASAAYFLATQGPKSLDYLTALHNLAVLYDVKGASTEAKALYEETLAQRRTVLGETHPEYLNTALNFSLLLTDMKAYAQAESLLTTLCATLSALSPTPHWLLDKAYFNLAVLYNKQGAHARADSLWPLVLARAFERLRKEFLPLPLYARQQFLENVLEEIFFHFQARLSRRETLPPAILELGYRAARSFKGILLTSTEGMRYLLEASRDSALLKDYHTWKQLHESLFFLLTQGRYEEADSVREGLERLESTLLRRLPDLASFLPDMAKEPLFPPLRSGEAAIEVVRIPFDTAVAYVHYLLVREGRRKALKRWVRWLTPQQEVALEQIFELYRTLGNPLSERPYELLWAPIERLLPKRLRKVYFAPDGLYYRVNVASLYDGQAKAFVGDKYLVQYVATTRRLLRPKPRIASTKPLVLGNPAFATKGEGGSRRLQEILGEVPALPAAETEVRLIANLLGVTPLIGPAATEEAVKKAKHPALLHLATHGYFIPMREKWQAGLLLAPSPREDGYLTTEEASLLALQGTYLVVLSACETALGLIRGEGLYGLQRAFLEAGAQQVIATLWPVEDAATQAFMTAFYKQLGRLPRRWKHSPTILQRTLRHFRRQYPHPYYWGAFVGMQ
ncbi:MAG: CHAT domain-containing tetratricopeptide repeat protein [Bacteroidia bacterium]